MIDYEMLETARQLCAKLDDYYFTIDFCTYTENEYSIDIELHHSGGTHKVLNSLNVLIEKLNELTKPEPKYKKGDTVWIKSDNDIHCVTVEMVSTQICDRYYLRHENGHCYLRIEDEIFSTSQALIEHQILYWSKLLQDECTHPNKYLQQDGKFDCDDCGSVGMPMEPPFEGKIEGFNSVHSGKLATPAKHCKTCQGYGDMRVYAGLGKYVVCEDCCHKPKCDHMIDPDDRICMTCHEYVAPECKHEYTFESGLSCAKCGFRSSLTKISDEMVRASRESAKCQHEFHFGARPHTKFSDRSDPKTWGMTCVKCGEFYR